MELMKREKEDIMYKKGKFFNKKNANIMFVVTIAFAIAFVIAAIVDLFMKESMGKNGEFVYIVFGILFILCTVTTGIIQLTLWFQNVSMHVTKYHGAECFEEIDSYIYNLGEGNNFYRSVIYEINKIYENSPDMEKLTKKRDLETLYERKTYLENNLDFDSNTEQIVTAFVVSAVVTIVQSVIMEGGRATFAGCIIIVAGLLLCMTFKYVREGRGGSYIYNLYEYELKLLNKKIQSVNENLQANEDAYITRILQLRHAISGALVNLYRDRKAMRRKGWKKKDIMEKYKQVNEASLLQGTEEINIVWETRAICGSQVFFPMKKGEKRQYLNETYKMIDELLQKIG